MIYFLVKNFKIPIMKVAKNVFKSQVKFFGIIALCFFLVSFSNKKEKNDWEGFRLNGEVKKLKEIRYHVKDKFGIIEKETKIDSTEFIFNEFGYLLVMDFGESKFVYKLSDDNKIEVNTWYNAGGGILSVDIHKYNHRGNNFEVDYCNSDGSIIIKKISKYNKRDNLIEEKRYSNGTLIRKNIYDDNENEIEEINYDSDGTIFQRMIYKYDDMGNISGIKSYNSSESVIGRWTMKYDMNGNEIERIAVIENQNVHLVFHKKYDEKNNLIQEIEIDNGLETVKNFIYEFDKKGNWIKKIEYENHIPKYIIEREIEFY